MCIEIVVSIVRRLSISQRLATYLMPMYRLHALPVVDAKHGNLVGIVTAKDVMRDVIRTASKALPAEDSYSQSVADIPDNLEP